MGLHRRSAVALEGPCDLLHGVWEVHGIARESCSGVDGQIGLSCRRHLAGALFQALVFQPPFASAPPCMVREEGWPLGQAFQGCSKPSILPISLPRCADVVSFRPEARSICRWSCSWLV